MTDIRVKGAFVERLAGGNLPALRVVCTAGGEAVLADASDVPLRDLVEGITLTDVLNGATSQVQILGPMSNAGWNWTPDAAIYVGTNGQLTQERPTAGWIRQVARAVSATLIMIDILPAEDHVDEQIKLPFAFGDATPEVIGTIPASLVTRVELVIEEAFDGSSPALKVGRSTALEELLAADQCNPAVAGSYETAPLVRYEAEQQLLLSITPGAGATAGRGVVIVTFQR